MKAMFDRTCPGCKRRYGWRGTITDCPPCPACGERPDYSELLRGNAQLAELETLMATHPKDATPRQLRRMREIAGLTVGQAVCYLPCNRAELMAMERGRGRPSGCVAAHMVDLYRCTDDPRHRFREPIVHDAAESSLGALQSADRRECAS